MVDRGGLRYTVAVEDQFSTSLRDFRSEISKSKDAWKAYKAELESVSAAATALKQSAEGLSKAATITVKTTQQSTEANRGAAKASDIRSLAERKLARDIKNSLVSIEARRVADEQGVGVYKRLSKEATLRQQAEAELARIVQKRAKDQILAQLAEQKGVSLQKTVNKELTVREAAEKKLAQILRQRAIQEQLAQVAAEKGVVLSQKKAAVFDAEAIALERIRKAEEKRAVASALQQRGFDTKGEPLQRQLSSQERAAKRVQDRISSLQDELEFRRLASGNQRLRELNRELKLTEGRANRISFTFRRLFGILAAFAAARLALQGIRQSIAESVRFNASIEQSELGIASLFTAVGQVRDAFGQATTSAQQLELAQRTAKEQTRQLRLEALQTAATFDQIVDTFQVAIAPGFTAGLDVNQIRKFSVQISQAAGALGVAQNQLSEEIRSILGGTIQLRTTRIAAALGITNEDIRRAKELGVLYEFLQDRFQAFTEAGKLSLETFNSLLTNTKDALLLLVAEAGFDFFTELKGLLKDIQGSITDISEEGVRINPEAKEVVKAILDGLKGAVVEARRLRSNISFQDVLGAARAVGAAIVVSAKLVGALVEGFVRGLGTLRVLIARVGADLNSIRGRFSDLIPVGDLREVGVVATQVVTALAGVAVSLKLVAGLASTVLIPFRAIFGIIKLAGSGLTSILGALGSIGRAAAKVPLPFYLVLLAAGALISVLDEILTNVFGVQVRFETIVKIVKVSLTAAFKFVASTVKVTFISLFSFLRSGFRTVIFVVQETVLEIADLVLVLLDKLGVGTDEALAKVRKLRQEGAKSFLDETAKDAEKIQAASEEAAQAWAEAAQSFKDGFTDAVDGNATAKTFAEFIEDFKKTAADRFAGLLDVDLGGDAITDQLQPLSEAFEELPGTIGKSADRLGETATLLAEVTEQVKDLRVEYEGVLRTAELTGTAAKTQRVLTEAEVAKRKQLLEVDTAIADTRNKIQAALAAESIIVSKMNKLRDEEFFLVFSGEEALRKQAELSRDLAEQLKEEALLRVSLKEQQKQGADEEIAQTQDRLKAARQRIESINEEIAKQKEYTDSLLEGLDPERAKEVQELILGIVTALGNQQSAQTDLQDLLDKRSEVESKLDELVEKRIGLITAEELPSLRKANAELESSLRLEQALSKLKKDSLFIVQDEFRSALVETEARIVHERELLTLKQEQRDRDAQALELLIAQTKDTETRISLQETLNELKREGSAEDQKTLVSLDESISKANDLQAALTQPIQSGILIGLKNFAEEYGTTTALIQQVTQLTENAVVGMADTISSALTDALDPSKQVNAAERLLSFVRDLANEIIKQFIRIAIARAIAGILAPGSEAGTAAAAASAGVAKGGPAPTWGAPSLAHFQKGTPGLSDGGAVPYMPAISRPAGLDPRDRVPVWMRPGEWAIVPESVRKYGAQFLSAINRGLIDPAITDLLLHKKGVNRVQRGPRLPGFAEGGPLTSQTARLAAEDASREQTRPVFALVTNDEQSMDRLLSGGEAAMLSFIENHRGTINQLLDNGKAGKKQ